MSRTVNLISRKSEVIEPVHEPLLINLHLLSERFTATVDESSTRSRLNLQHLIHIVGAADKDHTILHTSNILRRLDLGLINNGPFPAKVVLLQLPIEHNISLMQSVRNLQMSIL